MIVFLDIDETLIDQRRAEAAAAEAFLSAHPNLLPDGLSAAELCHRWRALREKHTRPFLEGMISSGEQKRRRMRELLGHRQLSDSRLDRLVAEFDEHYRRGWSLYDDVLPCLDALQAVRLGIISNGSSQRQRHKLQQFGLEDRFNPVVISEDVNAAKPRRELFWAACRQARCSPEQGVYVGDRLDHDALGSRGAGMRGIWLARDRDAPLAHVETIRSLGELPAQLDITARLPAHATIPREHWHVA